MLQPSTHRRRHRYLTAAALAVTAVGASLTVAANTAPAATAPAATSVPSKVSRPAASEGTTVSLWGIQAELPTGWTTDTDGPGGSSPNACLRSATTSMDVCSIDVYRHASPYPYPQRADGDFSGTQLDSLNLDSDRGWAIGEPGCRIPGTTDPGPVAGSELVRQDLITLADGRRADQRQWLVTCAGGATFTVGAWYLPVSNVLFYAYSVPRGQWDTYAGIIASMDLTHYQG